MAQVRITVVSPTGKRQSGIAFSVNGKTVTAQNGQLNFELGVGTYQIRLQTNGWQMITPGSPATIRIEEGERIQKDRFVIGRTIP